MKQAYIFGWLRFFHAAALCVLAAPALAAPRDDVNIINLSPPSGTVAGASSPGAVGPINSVEATIRYRLQSAPQGFITIGGEPFATYPTAMSPIPPIHFSSGNGDVRIRFSWLCNDRSPPSNPFPAVTVTMRGVNAAGLSTGVLVQKTQAVNFTFTCRPPSQIKRPSDAALTTPGESPMQLLNPQAQGSLLPADLVPRLTDPMTDVVRVRNIGAGPAPASTLYVNCTAAIGGAGWAGIDCPKITFPLVDVDGKRYVLIKIPSLAPGAEHVVNLKPWLWPAVRAGYSFEAIADYYRRVSESDERNTRRSILYTGL